MSNLLFDFSYFSKDIFSAFRFHSEELVQAINKVL